jgi:hypothetical protein
MQTETITDTPINGHAFVATPSHDLAPAPAHQHHQVLARTPMFDLTPKTLDEAMELARLMADSSFVPKDYQGKPGNVLVAIQWGLELGLKPLQAMQNIAVINGRPSLWGDAVLALVLASPVCVDVIEYDEGAGEGKTSVCIAKRKGREDKIARFSMADAALAGLTKKDGPWKQYPDRMRKMRARAFALRDQFADVLRGMPIAEEQMDIPADNGPGGHLNHGSAAPARLPANAKGSQIAESARPPLTEDGAAVIVTLTHIAKTQGAAALTKAWKDQPHDIRAQIGIAKRDEMLALGSEFDAARKSDATDVEPA